MTKKLHLKNYIMKEIYQNLREFFLLTTLKSKLAFVSFVMLFLLDVNTTYAQYISGDTSVCPNTVVTYNFSAGPWTITVLGGGSLSPVPGGPVNSFTIAWGNVPGSFLIRLVNGGTTIFQNVYVEGDIAMACDDLVNVSLNGNCQALITPGVLLEGNVYPDDSYVVTVYNPNNVPIPSNTVDYSHLGKTLTVNVRNICSGISCWGRIFIEDKFIPLLECNSLPVVISCDEDYSADSIGFPLPMGATWTKHPTLSQCYIVKNFDLCCDVELCYTDIYVKNGCNSTYYAQVERSWVAKDCKGNKTSCKDSIYLLQGSLLNLVCPLNYDGFQRPALKCDSINPPIGPYPAGWNALTNGNPSPYDFVENGQLKWRGTGVPQGIHCDHIAVTYRDIKIPVCGSSFKLLRTWRIFDWCTGELQECVQFIKVTDDRAPEVACSNNYIEFPTDYYKCTGTAIIPPPQLILDCSNTTFTVEYKLASPNGQPEAGDYRTDNVTYVNGNAVITGLPKDTTWVQFIVTDDCGNSTKCRIEVLIVDRLDPVAICDQHTVISINEQGIGQLYATSVNQGSYDNCEVDSMAIRRMNDWCGVSGNLDFGPKVTFCCEDLTRNPHMVVFRVWDEKGNFNDCMVSVTVQEKIPPTINCPPNITVDCGTDLGNLTLLGRATATNICSNTVVTYRDDTITWKCGSGSIRRLWIATAAGGQFTACPQSITVIDKNPITIDSIIWPADITINGCKATDAHPDFAGKPSYPTRPCSNLIAGSTDERFYNVRGFCIKIIRHWRVIDWCLYDVNDPNSAGIFKRDQIIYLRNTVAPIIDNVTCAFKETCANDLTCDANVNLLGVATDDCTDDTKLIWSYRVDLNNDGSFGSINQGNNASGLYSGGYHTIEWTVRDSCGNAATCNQLIRIKDCKQPTPFCKTGLIAVVMPTGAFIDVPARFFDEKSADNCTPQNKLRFSFTTNPNDSIKRFTCADIFNGIRDTIEITLYITDLDGNQTFCKTSLLLQDNNGNICPNKFTNGGIIAGLINTTTNSVLQNAHLELLKSDIMFGSINSDKIGEYIFVDLPEGEDYKLRPIKNDDISNGVSTADIVLMQKHILGLQRFNSVYQYIAADVNNSHSITAADISELRKLILGITNTFSNGTESWSFIKKSTVFDNPENPWENSPWETLYEVKALQGPNVAFDYMGVKMGDINYSAKTTDLNSGVEKRSKESLVFEFENHKLVKTGEISIPVYGTWNSELNGFQMTLEYNMESSQFIQIKSGSVTITDANYAMNQLDKGFIPVSWNSNRGITKTDMPLFYIILNVTKPSIVSDLVGLSYIGLNPEAYNEKMDVMDIEFRIKGTDLNFSQYELYQNQPNPFSESSVISFHIPFDQQVSISVYDIKGRMILNKELRVQKGKNQFTISKSEIGEAGIYYYQLKANNFNGIKKLILSK
ncbi:MAG: T9SS type A sorting domain-containing protein [Saprospiraceae bacterium]|nr:T9SS type A sorting domain-containing protein [Saprospiraceae bacterium]